MKAGDILRVEIERLAPNGSGAVTVEERDVLVAGAAPGDHVEIRVDSVSRQHPRAFASLRTATRSEAFRKPPCHHAAPTMGDCGGCPIMHVDDEAQLEAKAQWVNAALGDIGWVDGVIASNESLAYRNRSNFFVWRSTAGVIRLGSRVPGGEGFAKMDGCRILAEPLDQIASDIASKANEMEVPVGRGPGALRYVGLRSDRHGRVLVEFVTFGEADVLVRRLGAAVYNASDHVVGFVESKNTSTGNAVRLKRAKAVLGKDSLVDEVAGVPIQLWSDTFAQLNWETAEHMASRVAELAFSDSGPIWDIYSGVGVLGLAAAAKGGRKVLSAEVTSSAVDGAREAARKMGIEGRFEVIDLRSGLPGDWEQPGTVIVNPPRKGLHRSLVRRIAATGAPIIYMSCNPQSFAADATKLIEAGRKLELVEAYDMLPQTAHVELLARFI
ncbi:MAG: 23S rRNA (uracil-5-)-methyltransferase RumA [Bradymonadia bacterium]|jgi:23S rRNA (uracil-5-)-methyltransferase RumA